MRQPVHRQKTLKEFETKGRAESWARKFDHARQCNGLPLLVVEQRPECWAAVNPNVDARAQNYREPSPPPDAETSVRVKR